MTITVPNNMVGLVIGKGGENIRVMQVRSGASIQIQKDTDARPGATEREIYLSGDPAAVANAKQRTFVSVIPPLVHNRFPRHTAVPLA